MTTLVGSSKFPLENNVIALVSLRYVRLSNCKHVIFSLLQPAGGFHYCSQGCRINFGVQNESREAMSTQPQVHGHRAL